MSCADCADKARVVARARMMELETVADAHGFALWMRGGEHFEFLAVPTGPSRSTPQALMAALHGVRWGLPRPPSRKPHQNPPAVERAKRGNDDGMSTYRLRTTPPILLTFIDKLTP